MSDINYNKRVCTTDYDDTLIIHNYEMINGLYGEFCASYSWTDNLLVINELLKFQEDGFDIYIVTFRGPNTQHGSSSFNDRCPLEHIVYLKEKYGLIIKDIIFTDRHCKVPFINKLKSERHWDDDSNVICSLITLGSTARPVYVKHRNPKPNCTIDFYIEQDKIDVIEVENESGQEN